MDPVTLGVVGGSMIGSSLLQYMNSQEGQKATEAEHARMADLINKVQQPNFDMSKLSPEDYKVVGTYAPQMASFVQANAPQLVNVDSADAKSAKSAQQQALQQMLSQAKNGQDPIEEIQRAKAMRDASANSQSARNTLDQQMQRRGVGPGSGLQYAGNLQATSDAYQTDALAGQQAAADAAARRTQANTQAAGLGGQIYGQEASLAQKNADVMNNFNQWIRDAQQQNVNANTGIANSAQQFNLNQGQKTADQNTGLTNDTNKYNQSYGNSLQQQQYGNTVSKLGLQQGNSNQNVGDITNRTNQQNQAIQGVGEGISKVAMYNAQPSYSSNNPNATTANGGNKPYDPLQRR